MFVVTSGLEDMMMHFLPRRKAWAWDGRTRCMLRKGREERSRMDYRRWWDQESIDLEGVRAALGAAVVALKEEAEEWVGGENGGPRRDINTDGGK